MKTFTSNVRNFDLFRHQFRFILPGGFESVTSNVGVFATYVLTILVLCYSAVELTDVVEYGKSSITLDVIDYYYEDTEIFDLDKTPGLNVAFGITYYDDNPDAIDDLDYGEVVGFIK